MNACTTKPDVIPPCFHRFADDRRCGSPALRNERFCYYHHPTRTRARNLDARRRRRAFTLNPPTDRRELHSTLCQLVSLIAANQIDPRRAGLLLNALQTASTSL